jgi:hypothetical protein
MRPSVTTYGFIMLSLVASGLVPGGAAAAAHPHADKSADAQTAFESSSCPVTTPNNLGRTGSLGGGDHGNEALATSLWSAGFVEFKPGGSGCVEPDGYLGMKWPWWRSVSGALTIEGQRLDGSAGPLRVHVPKGYGETGFQATGLLFDGPGCWEVTGRVGNASLSFVTLVAKTAEGPAARCSQLFGGFHPQGQATTPERE